MKTNELTHQIIGAAIEVHRELGPGKPEVAYEAALACELALRKIAYQRQKPVPVVYKGVKLECGYRLDLLVNGAVVLEVKSVEIVIPVHRAQTITYLKLGPWQVGLLLNFNVAVLKEGIERFVWRYQDDEQAIPTAHQAGNPQATGCLPAMRTVVHCGDDEAEFLAGETLAASLEVHRHFGPGLLPSAYEECLCHELHLRGLMFERKRSLALRYKGTTLPETDEVQLLIGDKVVVHPGSLTEIQPVHEAQLLSQLRLGSWKIGLLINFNSISLGDGLRRIVNSGRRR